MTLCPKSMAYEVTLYPWRDFTDCHTVMLRDLLGLFMELETSGNNWLAGLTQANTERKEQKMAVLTDP